MFSFSFVFVGFVDAFIVVLLKKKIGWFYGIFFISGLHSVNFIFGSKNSYGTGK